MLVEKNAEQLHKEDLQRIEKLRLMDDDFMTACFSEYPEGVEFILRIIMNKYDLKVKRSRVQHVIKNLQGRSIWLDIDATDDQNREFDIEVQRADKGASPRRARYHSSIIDANVLNAGDDFELLPESYVIFITENDVLGKGEPIYEISRTIKGLNEIFDDGSHIIYVNGEVQNETALGKLMHDFYCTEPDDMYYNELAERARYFKKTEGGREKMCKIMEDMRNEAVAARNIEFARKLIARGKDTVEEIAELTGLTVEEVEALKGTLTA